MTDDFMTVLLMASIRYTTVMLNMKMGDQSIFVFHTEA
jgi:hypothetical protein